MTAKTHKVHLIRTRGAYPYSVQSIAEWAASMARIFQDVMRHHLAVETFKPITRERLKMLGEDHVLNITNDEATLTLSRSGIVYSSTKNKAAVAHSIASEGQIVSLTDTSILALADDNQVFFVIIYDEKGEGWVKAVLEY